MQTYQPENYVIQAAARHDFEAFYQQELEQRKALDYPPYSRLIRLNSPRDAVVPAQSIDSSSRNSTGKAQTSLIGAGIGKMAAVRWQIICGRTHSLIAAVAQGCGAN